MLCVFVGNEARHFTLKDKTTANVNASVAPPTVPPTYTTINGHSFVGMFPCTIKQSYSEMPVEVIWFVITESYKFMIHFYNKENENDFAGSVNLLFGATVFYYICPKKKSLANILKIHVTESWELWPLSLLLWVFKSCLLSRTVEFDIEQTTCIPWHLISILYGSLSFLTSSMCHALYNHSREFRRYHRDLHCEHGCGSVYSGLQSGLWGQDHIQCCHGDRGCWQNSTHHWHNHY